MGPLLGRAGGRGDESEGAPALDSLPATVHAEFVVEVTDVRLDRVFRQIQLPGDLRGRQAGREIAQDPQFTVAETLGQGCLAGSGGLRVRAVAEEGEDLRDE